MECMIEIENLSLTMKKQVILSDINLTFEKGKIHGLIGRNGSGKTMLMKCILGFIRPSQGTIWVDHKRIGKEVDFPPHTGVIIETPGFLPNLTGMRNLELLASLRKKIDKKAVAEAIRAVGLDPEMKKPVSKYSLGMRQRLGIAQALMEDPSLLILDEPFNGLDKDGVSQMHELILAQKKKGKTILLSSHSQKDIDVLCDVVCEMDGGVMHCVRDRIEE